MNSQSGAIKFACHNCGARLKTAGTNEGKKITCSKCGKSMRVPQQLSELDVVFDESWFENKPTAVESEEQPLTIDFDFSDDIDEVLARAKEIPPEPPPETTAPVTSSPDRPTEKPARPRMVIADENLPQKKKSQKEIAKRLKQEAANEDTKKAIPESTMEKSAADLVSDDDAEDENLHPTVRLSPNTKTGNEHDRPPAEEDTSPLRVEGITDDLVDVTDLYGVKCEICDTRIHVTRAQVDTVVECPVCFSKVMVTPPKKASNRRDWMGPQPGFVPKVSDSGDELKLSDPIDREKPEYFVSPDHGLPTEDRDLLAPLPTEDDLDSPVGTRINETDESRNGGENKQNSDDNLSPRKSRPARKSHLARNSSQLDLQPPIAGSETKASPVGKLEAKQKPTLRQRFEESNGETETQKPLSVHTAENLKPLTMKSLTEIVTSAVIDSRVIWRAAIAIVMLTVGGYAYSVFAETIGEDGETGFVGLFQFLLYGSLYLFIYGAATAWLWFICSFIFRDTARGFSRVDSFQTQGFDDIKSTFLLFAISFAIAGSPFLVLKSYVSAPMRLLIAPMLLIVAWYNQSAFIGISFDPFKTIKTETSDWKLFYVYVGGLAFASMLAGLFYAIPYCEFIGATIMVFAALSFAAVTGWHCGRMVKKLEDA